MTVPDRRWLRAARGGCVLVALFALCTWIGTRGPGPRGSSGLLTLAGVLALLTVMVSLALWDATRARRLITEIGAVPSDMLDELSLLLGVGQAVCLDTDVSMAVCAGAWSPEVFVSRGLVEALSAEELTAVLLHEHAHRRRRDPLRRALRHRWARTVFFIPMAAWWDDRARTREEIAADAVAVRRCGSRPLARALLIAGGMGYPGGVAALGGSPTLRIRTLAGDSVSLGVPSPLTCLQSLAGAGLVVAPLLCLAGVPAGL